MRSLLVLLAPTLLLLVACATDATHHCTGTCGDAGHALDASTDAAPPHDAHDDGSTPLDAGTTHDAAPDTGVALDAGTHADGGVHGDGGSAVDGGPGAIDAGPGCAPGVACTTLDFPNLGDTYSTTFYMMTGDSVEGMRVTALPAATGAHMVMNIRFNDLSCDELDFRVLLNSVEIGTFNLLPPAAVGDGVIVDKTFAFPSVAGPTYTLRYEVTHAPPSSCGPVVLETHGNTVALSP